MTAGTTYQVSHVAKLGGSEECVKVRGAEANAVELLQGNAALSHFSRRPSRLPHVSGRELCGEEVSAGKAFQLSSGAALEYAHDGWEK